jgi:membrane associated rhomboid family serine protease
MFPFSDTISTQRWAVVTYVIVAINVASFLWLQSLPPGRQQEVVARHGFVAARIGQLSDPQKPVLVPIEQQVPVGFGWLAPVRRLVQLPPNPTEILASTITCMFLHGGWLHLIGNMWFLLIFGDNVEDRLGPFLYTVFYLLGGLAATATQWAISPGSTVPMIGASGAIAAVLGGCAVTYPHARVKTLVFLFIFITVIEIPALLFMALWFGAQLLQGLGVLHGGMENGVAWWAHVGGFVFGAILMPILSSVVPQQKIELVDDQPQRHDQRFPPGYDSTRWW